MKGLVNKIMKATLPLVVLAMPYISSAQSKRVDYDPQTKWEELTKGSTLKAGYDGVSDEEWQNQGQHPDVRNNYLGFDALDYVGSGDADNDEDVDLIDAQLAREGQGEYRADVVAPFTGVPDSADADAIEAYVNGTGKLVGKDFYTTDKGITNEERKDYILGVYNGIFMNMVSTIPTHDGTSVNMYYPGFDCFNYAELAASYFQGWTNPEAFFEEYWYDEAKSVIDTSYNHNLNGIFNLQCNTSDHGTAVGGGHTSLIFPLVGDLTKEENYLRIDSQTGRKINFGDPLLPYGEYPRTEWLGNTERWGPIRGPPIIQYIVNEDGSQNILWENPDYNFYKDNANAIFNPGIEEHNLKVHDEGKTLRIDYFADGAEKVKVKVHDINGKLLKTIDDFVMPGSNTINMEDPTISSGMNIVTVEDEDKSNVQVQKYINFK